MISSVSPLKLFAFMTFAILNFSQLSVDVSLTKDDGSVVMCQDSDFKGRFQPVRDDIVCSKAVTLVLTFRSGRGLAVFILALKLGRLLCC